MWIKLVIGSHKLHNKVLRNQFWRFEYDVTASLGWDAKKNLYQVGKQQVYTKVGVRAPPYTSNLPYYKI